MWVLGLNGPPIGWHDGAACLVDGDGNVVAMSEEERFTREKHALRSHATNAARFCLDEAGIEPEDVDVVAIGWDLPRILPRMGGEWDFASPRRFLSEALGWKLRGRGGPELVCVPHHRAHAISAFYASGWDEAAVLVNDGNGEDESISIYEARFGEAPIRREVWPRSHSLGYLYDAACRAIGLNFLEAGKTMGLAAYGRARELEPAELLRSTGADFEPPFDLPESADYDEIIAAWEPILRELAPGGVTTPSADLDQDEDAIRIAWSAQSAVEQVVLSLVEHARAITGMRRICLAGGVALNCSANGLLSDPLYVPPVSHDAGGALGAAWAIAPPREPQAPLSPFLGADAATPAEVPEGWSETALDAAAVAGRVMDGKVGAIARGRAEVGPRALGHRSIIALPDSVEMRDRVNRMKGRERWRPLAPIGAKELDGEFWSGPREVQRYMLGAQSVTPLGRERIAGTVHVDGTARAQVATGTGLVEDVLGAMRSGGAGPRLDQHLLQRARRANREQRR